MNKPVTGKNVGKILPDCRLRFAFAPKANRGVIVRRGPSKWVRLILWDTNTDKFTPGQWLNGPIRSFDLSPNGEHFIYFVSYHKTRAPGLWVALSKPPYLTALAMWPISDAWGGFCSFIDQRKIYIEKGMHQPSLELSPDFKLRKYSLTDGRYNQDWKMERDGWSATVPEDHPTGWGKYYLEWKKVSQKENLTLSRQNMKPSGTKPDFWLEGSAGKIKLVNVERADFDPQGNLVLAKEGSIYRASYEENNRLVLNELANFNNQTPEELEAPSHAKRW